MSLDPTSHTELLATIPAFADLDSVRLRAVAEQLDELTLVDGEVLMKQGDPGDALYFVLSGALEVSVANADDHPVVVDRLGVGAVIGEMALLAGNRRSATVTALGAVNIACLTRAGFDRLTELEPGLREQVVAAITPRLERVQLAAVLEQWFGIDSDDSRAIHDLQEATEWSILPAGEALYQVGDAADGMFIVVSGRLRVTPGAGPGSGPVAGPGVVFSAGDGTADGTGSYDVARGESIGELAVLGGERREERVVAVRDSHLLRVPTAVVEAHPLVMRRIARTAVRRVSSPGTSRRHGNGLRSIALIPAHPGAPVRDVAELLERELLTRSSLLVLDENFVSEAFGGTIPTAGTALGASLTHWLNELEAEHEHLVLLAEDATGPWSDRCRRQADAVLLVADAGSPTDAQVHRAPAGAQLVLLHKAGTERPTGTAAWIESTGLGEVHHIRAGDGYGVPRMVRRLTGQAIGLVFSGGGARGYAHIGLLRAIEELGIEIDMVAGTSMGALIAGVFALDGKHEVVEHGAVMFGDKKHLLDRTLPLVALMKSQGVTDTFRSIFADTRIEDLWIPFACVSANLFEAVPVEHRTGLMWEAVRASTAIPGIFTPFVKDGGLLVDGAVMNAFPVDLMREMVGTGTVIGSSTMSRSTPREPFTFGPSVSGWEALSQYFKPRSRRTRYPTMIKTLMEATSVGSKHQSKTTKAIADIVVELPVKEFGKLEFHRHEELIELGYQHALTALREWLG